MIGLLTAVGTALGGRGRVAPWLGGLALAILAIGLLWAAKSVYDRNVVKRHEDAQAATDARADREADAKAATERREDDNRIGNEAVQLGKAVEHAETDRDRRIARQRCIRLQQDARASGRVAPTC